MSIKIKLSNQDLSMEHYIFIVNDSEDIDGNRVSSHLLAQRRLDKACWPLYARTPHRSSIKKDDVGIIYLAGKGNIAQQFFALFTVKDIIDFSNKYSDIDGDELIITPPTSILLLEKVQVISPMLSIKNILDQLSFIPANRIKWGAVMQTGCRKISKHDYACILKNISNKEHSQAFGD